jgi:hypothetical protein
LGFTSQHIGTRYFDNTTREVYATLSMKHPRLEISTYGCKLGLFSSVLLVCHTMMSGRCTYRTAFSQIDLIFSPFFSSDDLFGFTFCEEEIN